MTIISKWVVKDHPGSGLKFFFSKNLDGTFYSKKISLESEDIKILKEKQILSYLFTQNPDQTGIIPLYTDEREFCTLEGKPKICIASPLYPFTLRTWSLEKERSALDLKKVAQMLIKALKTLEKHDIQHFAVLPDHILVDNEGKAALSNFDQAIIALPNKLEHCCIASYSAPEELLGLNEVKYLGVWNLGVSLVEAYLGEMLFPLSTDTDIPISDVLVEAIANHRQTLGICYSEELVATACPLGKELYQKSSLVCDITLNKTISSQSNTDQITGDFDDICFSVDASINGSSIEKFPVTDALEESSYIDDLSSEEEDYKSTYTGYGKVEESSSWEDSSFIRAIQECELQDNPLTQKLLRAAKKRGEEGSEEFKDFLDMIQKMLIVEPWDRISLADLIQHPYIKEEIAPLKKKTNLIANFAPQVIPSNKVKGSFSIDGHVVKFASCIDSVLLLEREKSILQKIAHKNIIKVKDCGVIKSTRNLLYTAIVLDCSFLKSPLSVTQALKVIKDLGEALSYLDEKKIIHGNFSKEAVFLGAKNVYKLGSFERASMAGIPASQNDCLSSYSSPEQVLDCNVKTSAIDMWGLGVLLVELLAEEFIPLPQGELVFSAAYLAASHMVRLSRKFYPIDVANTASATGKTVLLDMHEQPRSRLKSLENILVSLADENPDIYNQVIRLKNIIFSLLECNPEKRITLKDLFKALEEEEDSGSAKKRAKIVT